MPIRGIYSAVTLPYLWEIFLAGGTIEKEIINLCCLSTFAWIFPAISAAHFLAFAFLCKKKVSPYDFLKKRIVRRK